MNRRSAHDSQLFRFLRDHLRSSWTESRLDGWLIWWTIGREHCNYGPLVCTFPFQLAICCQLQIICFDYEMGRGFFVKTELLVVWYDLPAASRLKSRSQALPICIPCKQRKQLLLKKLWSKSSWRCTCVWRCQFLRLHNWVLGPPRQLFISDVFGCVRTPISLAALLSPMDQRTIEHILWTIHFL